MRRGFRRGSSRTRRRSIRRSGFEYPSHAEAEAAGRGEIYIYSRDANPTEDRLAHAIAELEVTEDACIFSSGMGAISAAILPTWAPAGTSSPSRGCTA